MIKQPQTNKELHIFGEIALPKEEMATQLYLKSDILKIMFMDMQIDNLVCCAIIKLKFPNYYIHISYHHIFAAFFTTVSIYFCYSSVTSFSKLNFFIWNK